MIKFLKNLLASFIGTSIALGVMFMFLLVCISVAAVAEEPISISENSVLEISFDKPLKDYGGKYEYEELKTVFEEYDGLNNVLTAIEYAANDSKIKGISINNSFLNTGAANAKSIRDALVKFKESGKFIYAYGAIFLQKDYYLASVADSIFLNPVGKLDFRGLSTEVYYLKELQEKSGVKMEVVRHGKYKSAVEPFMSDKMSVENKKQIKSYLQSIWGMYVADISESRNVSEQMLNKIADQLLVRTPMMAVQNKLIDGLFYIDEYENLIKKRVGLAYDETISIVSAETYAEYSSKKNNKIASTKIAVIYAQGDIIYGRGDEDYIGEEIILESLEEVRKDENVEAIVVRINSPGGVALTSEIIWHEIQRTNAIKPVVISLGDVAASGGYYMAVAGGKIFAEPSTITGSIGVFATIPNMSGLAAKWGINAEQVSTHNNAVGYSAFEPAADTFKKYVQEDIEAKYQTFLERVAQGRNMSVDEVHEIAQGRVWTGEQAKENGLIDEIGGLGDAIAYAAEVIQAPSYSTVNYPIYKTSFGEIFENLAGFSFLKSQETILKETIGEENYKLMRYLQGATQQKGIQARLPYELKIQ